MLAQLLTDNAKDIAGGLPLLRVYAPANACALAVSHV